MAKLRQITIRLDEKLYKQVKHKCKEKFAIGMAPLIKIFLKSFVTQNGVGFYVGDDDLCKLFTRWLLHQKLEKTREARLPSFMKTRLRDIFELGNNGMKHQIRF